MNWFIAGLDALDLLLEVTLRGLRLVGHNCKHPNPGPFQLPYLWRKMKREKALRDVPIV